MKKELEYFYNGRIALKDPIFRDTKLNVFENGLEAVFQSTAFKTYEDCATDGASLLSDICSQINHVRPEFNFVPVWEINPKISGNNALIEGQKSWGSGELIRFYVIDQIEAYKGVMPKPKVLLTIFQADANQNVVKPSLNIKH